MTFDERAIELYDKAVEDGILDAIYEAVFDDHVNVADRALGAIERDISEEDELDPDTKDGQALCDALLEHLIAGFS